MIKAKHEALNLYGTAIIAASVCFSVGCVRACPSSTAALAPSLVGDTVELVRVEQLDGRILTPGETAHFVVHLSYSLNSLDSAIVTVNMDQFPNPESCVTPKAANPAIVASSKPYQIQKGSGTLEIPMQWPGDGSETRGQGITHGAISFQAAVSLHTLSYTFMTRSFGTQFCQRF